MVEAFEGIRIKGVNRLLKEFPAGWNLNSLTHLHSVVSGILHENGDSIDSRWSATFAELCRIILQEESRQKWSQEWTSWQKMKAT
jgi:hypothetical protein